MKENIYSTAEYQSISEVENAQKIILELPDSGNTDYTVHGMMHNGVVKFGMLAPFWWPRSLNDNSDINTINQFVLNLLGQSLKHAENIEIRLPPNIYNHNIDTLKYLLLKNNFKLKDIAIWQFIPLQNFQDGTSYESSLKHSSRKVLNNFRRKYNGKIKQVNLQDQVEVSLAYHIIVENRKSMGVNLKYSLAYLFRLIDIEYSRVKIFTFSVDDVELAAAICHITNDDVLYVAAWGDACHELSHSPMYDFAVEMVKFCLVNEIKFLDYGVSSTLDQYLPGLFSFKKNIGCFSTVQETFSYRLSEI